MVGQGNIFSGVVTPGRGLGVKLMSTPSMLQAVHRFTDLRIVPGTLNVRLPQPFDGNLEIYLTENDLGVEIWRDHAPNRRGLRLGEVIIAGRYRGFVFQGDEPEYPPDQVELLSDRNLRETLGLRDGDTLEFSLVVGKREGKTQ